MTVNHYLSLNPTNGRVTDTVPATSSTANAIVAAGSDGKININFMPAGVGADTDTITTSETVNAGNLVNVWTSSGRKVRNADNVAVGKEAHGFVLTTATSGNPALVYFAGLNTAVTDTVVGRRWLGTAGATVSDPSSITASGSVIQNVGELINTNVLQFTSGDPGVVLA